MSALTFDIPMVTRFRSITRRRGMVCHGDAGWGEFSPFEEYSPQEALPWLRAAREAADLGFPEAVRTAIPVNVTIPAVGPDRAAAMVAASGGCRTAKVKVAEPGQSAREEADRVAAVRDALGADGAIRVDANGSWDVDTAVERIAELDRAAGGLQYAEQPCAHAEDLAAVRRRVRVPIAADESIRRASDPLRVKELGAADVVVLKVQPLGGVRACLALAERIDMPVVVSSAVETSVGIAMGLALAASLPTLDFACGLATTQLLSGDLVEAPFAPADGMIQVRPVEPTPALLARHRADAAVAAWWDGRLRAVEALEPHA
jgi:O-succinylbenzoate synthase